MSVSEATERISSSEFSDWCAYLSSEPDIGTRLDYLSATIGQLISMLIACNGAKPPEIGARLIDWDGRDMEAKRKSDNEAFINALKAMAENRKKAKNG